LTDKEKPKAIHFGVKLRRQYHVDIPAEDLLSRFKSTLNHKPEGLTGKVVQHHVYLKIDGPGKHGYSPESTLTIEKTENGAYVREVTGPNPAVFTFSMFLLFLTIVVLIFAILFLFTQISLDLPTNLTRNAIIGILIFLGLVYAFMYYGRWKARPQMDFLRSFIEKVINET
jgi:hypothetical protein